MALTLFFLDHPDVNGLFNVGSGQARSWNAVARALFAATGQPGVVDYTAMPDELRGKYQYYTCADMTKLKAAGCRVGGTPLAEAVDDYVQNYLDPGAYLEAD